MYNNGYEPQNFHIPDAKVLFFPIILFKIFSNASFQINLIIWMFLVYCVYLVRIKDFLTNILSLEVMVLTESTYLYRRKLNSRELFDVETSYDSFFQGLRIIPVPSVGTVRRFSSSRIRSRLQQRWGCTTCAPIQTATIGGLSEMTWSKLPEIGQKKSCSRYCFVTIFVNQGILTYNYLPVLT